MKSSVCITVENSPNASSVYIRLCKHRKKVFYCFYKINFPRKNAKLFVWQWLKEKFLPLAKSCPRSLARVISSCFVNLSSFELENFFKFVLAWLAREKQNVLTPQPCLHTLVQTRLSANQSARTILVIFNSKWKDLVNWLFVMLHF